MVNLAKKLVAGSVERGTVNGEEVVIFHLDDGPMVFGGDVHDGRFVSVQVQRNPDKLTHLLEPTDLR
jgi:hypothetical protein